MLPTLTTSPLYSQWLNVSVISTLPLGSNLSSTPLSGSTSWKPSPRLSARTYSRAISTTLGSRLTGNSRRFASTVRPSFTREPLGLDGRTLWFAIKSRRPMTSLRSTWFLRTDLPYLPTSRASTFPFNDSSMILASTNPDSKLTCRCNFHFILHCNPGILCPTLPTPTTSVFPSGGNGVSLPTDILGAFPTSSTMDSMRVKPSKSHSPSATSSWTTLLPLLSSSPPVSVLLPSLPCFTLSLLLPDPVKSAGFKSFVHKTSTL